MSGFVSELKRRNVLRVGAAYLVASWLILQIVDVVFPMLGVDESFARPVLILLMLGLPAVLVFAWVFELTPQGIKREKNVDRSASVTAQTGRKLDRVIIVILVFAVGLLLADRFFLQKRGEELATESTNLDSVAVLPFVNMSGLPENEYFSDGLTETLLHMLAQVQELKVAARTSSFAFKGRDADIREIAESLDVATVLEGSVQRAGDRVRITAQLIEAEGGFHIWSKTFDRSLDDIFSVQDEIATSVASALRASLLDEPDEQPVVLDGVGTDNAQAYEKYLLGLEQLHMASYSSLPRAEGLFKEALVLDANFIEAKVELAKTYLEQADTGLIERDESASRMRPLLEQVVAANPVHGRALGALAMLEWRDSSGLYGVVSPQAEAAVAKLERAIASSPSEPNLYDMMAAVARANNEMDAALNWLDRGLEVDPLSADLHWKRGGVLLWQMDDPVAAEESFARASELAPDWTAPYGALADAARVQSKFAESLHWDLQAMELDPQDHELPAEIGSFLFQLGLFPEGDEMLARAQLLAPDAPVTRRLELERHVHAGNHERVVMLAQQMLSDDVSTRRGAWNAALASYVDSKIALDRIVDIIPYFESLRPGSTASEYEIVDPKDIEIRFFVAQVLSMLGRFEEASVIYEPLVARLEETEPRFRENDGAMMMVANFRGDMETAVGHALKDLEQSYGRDMLTPLFFRLDPWLAGIAGDDRVAARLAELDAERQIAADEVREYLASL